MIVGTVNATGLPLILLTVAGQSWPAMIDTGFNGDLELPDRLRSAVNPRLLFRSRWSLAGGQILEEDTYLVDILFDNQIITAEASFVPDAEILIGTGLLQRYRLEINFVAQTVLLERVP